MLVSTMGIGGWLLGLCFVLLIWSPFTFAMGAAGAMRALPMRGPGLGFILAAQLVAAAIGIGAGLAIVQRRAGAVTLARFWLASAAAVDVLTYATPYFPKNRPASDLNLILMASLVHYAIWFVYLARSKRVRATF
jgi:hypothetical protein